MMKILTRVISIAIETLLLISLLGCDHVEVDMEKDQEELEILNNTYDIVVNAFQKKDIDALYSVLSAEALATDDLEVGFEYSCKFFTEEILSVDLSYGYSGGTTEHGTNRASGFRCVSATLTTVSGNSIDVWFEYWFNNDFSPNKIGVNRIKINYTDETFKDNYIGGSRYIRSGIYNPDWDNDNN